MSLFETFTQEAIIKTVKGICNYKFEGEINYEIKKND